MVANKMIFHISLNFSINSFNVLLLWKNKSRYSKNTRKDDSIHFNFEDGTLNLFPFIFEQTSMHFRKYDGWLKPWLKGLNKNLLLIKFD